MTKSTIFGTSKGYDIQVGSVYETDKPLTLFPRAAGKDEHAIKDVIGFKVTAVNPAGRRFTAEFYNANRETVSTRKVYREYIEAMIDQMALIVGTIQPVEVEATEVVSA
jgi:cobyric acid synthase